METNRLKQFVALVQTKNLRKAAEITHGTHGAFHKSMRVLQSDLGFKLYTVDGRSIVITPEGEKFYGKVKTFLEAEKALLREELTTPSRMRIATHETFATYLLAPHWESHFTDLVLDCREMLPGRLEEAVEQGVVDLGLSYELIPRLGLETILLARVEMAIYGVEKFRNVPFEGLPFVAPILPLETIPSAARGLDGWPDALVPRKILHRVELLSTALQLVAQGSCVIFIPHFVATSYSRFLAKKHSLFSIHSPLKLKSVIREVFLVQRMGAKETREVRRFAKAVTTLLRCKV